MRAIDTKAPMIWMHAIGVRNDGGAAKGRSRRRSRCDERSPKIEDAGCPRRSGWIGDNSRTLI
jgi:hypothetical protein